MLNFFSMPMDSGAPPQEQNEGFDFKSSSPLDITVSQLVFSGGYIVGLQTSKTYKSLSEIALTKSINDLKETVTSNYFMVLVLNENLKQLDTLLSNTQKLYNETLATFKLGFIEETDVDQVKIVLSNLKNQVNNLKRQVDISERLFKYTIGMDLNNNLEFTDSLNSLITETQILEYAVSDFNVENYADYQLVKNQEKLMELNLRYQKTNFFRQFRLFIYIINN
ncbi:MAG: TolC family protein [Bacteroidales bacterium]|nr:TolC family protein [Bacteroidales bacterium]